MRYRKYIRSGGPVPRSTISSRRKTRLQRRRKTRINSSELQSNIAAAHQQHKVCERSNSEEDNHEVINEFNPHRESLYDGSGDAVCSEADEGGSRHDPYDTVGGTSNLEERDEDAQVNIEVKKQLTLNLCKCSDTTVGDVVYMCLALGLRHNLTWKAIEDILKMFISIHGNSELPQCKKTLFKILNSSDQEISYHIFCSVCEILLGVRQAGKCSVKCYLCSKISDNWEEDQLKCNTCRIVLAKKENTNWFITCQECNGTTNAKSPFVSLSLEKQFQKTLQDTVTADLLISHRFTRQKINQEALEDIYDGEEYQKHFNNGGILASPYNFSYTFNTDGISTGKSTCKTMWPIFVKINELPYRLRNQNTLLCGLYVGKKDPNQLIFLEPFVNEANKLSTEGFKWTHRGKQVNSKAIPLCAVLDSVARCQVLNMQTFHAFYGFTYCYQQQKRTDPRKRRFDMVVVPAEERTSESTYQDAVLAYQKRDLPRLEDRAHRGVKGPSIVVGLLYFNLIWGFAIDYMHAILLGIVKTHMKLLFEASRRKYWLNVIDRTAIDDIYKSIDERLLHIKPPTGITRVPRSICMWRSWKASEWRSWLLFYCIPCLHGLIKDKYLVHFSMLSKAVSLLLQNSVTLENVNEAHSLLMEYCCQFQKYFDIKDTIYNLHLLTHIKRSVLSHGPLWTANAFSYESQNRHILQLYTSPRNVLYQIVRRFEIYSTMPSLCDKFVSSYNALEFSEKLLERRLSRVVEFTNGILIGKPLQLGATNEVEEILFSKFGVHCKDCLAYKRMLYKGMRITSIDYSTGKENNDSYVMCKSGSILCVKHIILLPDKTPILLGNKIVKSKTLIVDHWKVKIQHIRAVKREGSLMLVSPAEVVSQCVYLKTSQKNQFVTFLPPCACYGD